AAGFSLEWRQGPGAEELVVVAPTRAPVRAPDVAALPSNRGGLARLIERELERVGCYRGPITGAWDGAAQRAMQAVLVHANARLPVDRPDPVLLRLVQGEEQRVCARSCGQRSASAGDDCMPAERSAAAPIEAVPAERASISEPRTEQRPQQSEDTA